MAIRAPDGANKGKYDEFDDNIDDNKLVNNDDDGDVTSSPSY